MLLFTFRSASFPFHKKAFEGCELYQARFTVRKRCGRMNAYASLLLHCMTLASQREKDGFDLGYRVLTRLLTLRLFSFSFRWKKEKKRFQNSAQMREDKETCWRIINK